MAEKTAGMKSKKPARAQYRETKRLKAHARNEIILKAAKKILVTEGFSALNLRYAAEESGIRLATLQYYYNTRDQLFRAAFEDALVTERQRINRLIVNAGNSPGSILRARISGHYKASLKDETASFFYELWARSSVDRFTAELMDGFYEPYIATLAGLIGDFNPALSNAEARRRTVFVVATLEGMTVMADVDRRNGKRVKPTEKYIVDTLMDFLGRPAGAP